ncbi:MAG: hypothetical protein KR126chlam6_00436 [Candidatus Anoxychlamydiales bacterium]|nr:hypothetical protein [Candidatus Anoxychlamydiales bacterium]
MIIRILFLAVAFFMISCSSANEGQNQNNKKSQRNNFQVVKVRDQKDEFTIIVLKDHTMNKIARKKAIEKAASVANESGYKSFDVVKEENVKIMLGKKDWPSAWDFPQNLYEEEIVQKGYNRDRMISGSQRDYKIRSALKVQVKCYFDKDKGQYKVCDIIKCS